MDRVIKTIWQARTPAIIAILLIAAYIILEKKIFKKKRTPDKLKRTTWVLGLALLVSYCFFYAVNKYAYGKPTFSILPHKVTMDLWKIYRHTRSARLKSDVFYNYAMKAVVPIATYIFLGLYVFLSNDRRKTSSSERDTIKGSARWAEKSELIKAGYLIPFKDVLEQKTELALKKEHKEPLSIILGQYNDADIDSSNPQQMRTQKWSRYIAGANIRKFNTLTIGGIGSGKGAGTICPTLLTYPDSVICYDPAQENFNVTCGYRQSIGYVQRFDPSDPDSTLHFNPFDWIRRSESYITADIGNMSQIIIPPNPNAKDNYWENSARDMLNIFIGYTLLFFPKDEQNLKKVTEITQIADYNKNPFLYKNMKKRLGKLDDGLLDNTDGKSLQKEREFLVREIESVEEEERQKKELAEQIAKEINPGEKKRLYDIYNRTKTRLEKERKKEEELEEEENATGMFCLLDTIMNNVEYRLRFFETNGANAWEKTLLNFLKMAVTNLKINAKAEQTISSTFSTMFTNLSFFAEQTVASLMKDTSFTTDDLMRKAKPLSIFLCVKNADTDRCKAFIKLFISSVINQLTDDYTKPYIHHLLFILDEFPQLGYMKNVEFAMPFVRKYHISFMLIIQSISQLEDSSAYGKDKTKAILDNTRVIDIKQVSQEETASWISRRLGNRTVALDSTSHSYKAGGGSTGGSQSIREEARALMDANEIMTMSPDTELLVIASSPSSKVKKLQYFEHPELKKRQELEYNPDLPTTEREERKRFEKESMKKVKEIFKSQEEKKKDETITRQILKPIKTPEVETPRNTKRKQRKEKDESSFQNPALEDLDGDRQKKQNQEKGKTAPEIEPKIDDGIEAVSETKKESPEDTEIVNGPDEPFVFEEIRDSETLKEEENPDNENYDNPDDEDYE